MIRQVFLEDIVVALVMSRATTTTAAPCVHAFVFVRCVQFNAQQGGRGLPPVDLAASVLETLSRKSSDPGELQVGGSGSTHACCVIQHVTVSVVRRALQPDWFCSWLFKNRVVSRARVFPIVASGVGGIGLG